MGLARYPEGGNTASLVLHRLPLVCLSLLHSKNLPKASLIRWEFVTPKQSSQVIPPFLLTTAGYSALIALEAAALLFAIRWLQNILKYGFTKSLKSKRCEKSVLFLPFLLHVLIDILLTLAAGIFFRFHVKQLELKSVVSNGGNSNLDL